jgi:ABC-type Fe3+ transport system permease subunit
LVGSLYSFILALQEASATLLLVVPGHEMMTVGIFNFYIGGSVNEAAALGLILIILGACVSSPSTGSPAPGWAACLDKEA